MAVKCFFKRSRRRGFALLDLLLAISAGALIAAAAVPLATHKLSKKASRAEIANVAVLADIGLIYVELNLAGNIQNAQHSSNLTPNLKQITTAELEAVGLSPGYANQLSSSGRDLELWMYAPPAIPPASATEIIVLARASGALRGGRRIILEPSFTAGKVGAVFVNEPAKLVGPGVNWDMTTFKTNTGVSWPEVDDLLALRHSDTRATSDLYLHRNATGQTSLNTMETDLVVQGNISAGGRVTAAILEADSSTFSTLDVTNAVTFSDVITTGDVTANSLTVNGTTSAANITASGIVTVANALTANSAAITGTVTAGTVVIDSLYATTGELTIDTATIAQLVVPTLEVSKAITVSGDVTITGGLTVGSCVGC